MIGVGQGLILLQPTVEDGLGRSQPKCLMQKTGLTEVHDC